MGTLEKHVSVIIPVKNGANYLREAIESLKRQDVPLEITVVDDGSDDDTAAIASGYGCVVLSHPVSKGQVAAKNTGLAAVKGDYVLFMDHDDVMREGALKALLDSIEAEPDVSAVQAMVKDFVSPEIGSLPGTLIRPEPYYGLFTGAILIRRSVFDVIGPFSESRMTGEIIEWSTKMEANGLIVKKLDLVSTDRRVHRSNFGKTNRGTEFKDYASILRERLKMVRK
ncbi:MAG: glycosyltransferase family 2 protein [Bacteroidales bacterium]|nr:glycosyltransferase family 2 protein [Bacteroidales bacterium]